MKWMLKDFEKKEKARGIEPPKFPGRPVFQSLYTRMLGSILTGILLALSFPGYNFSNLVFVAFVPLMFAVQSVSLKRAAWLGLLSGFVFFTMSLSWLHNLTRMVDSTGLRISAMAGYAFLSLYCGLYFIPFTIATVLVVRKWIGDHLRNNVRAIVVLTMVWVGAEYVRGILLTGFPWNPLGVSQYSRGIVISQIAQWGGVYLVSAVIVWLNVALFITLRQYTHGVRLRKYRAHMELMVGLVPLVLSIIFGMKAFFHRAPTKAPITVALVQPDIKQAAKWDDTKDEEIRKKLDDLTVSATRLPGIDMVVWPETAVPDVINNPRTPQSYDLVHRVTEQTGVPLLVGAMDVAYREGSLKYYNSSILFDVHGHQIGHYSKQHLVPFGEYVPFPGFMRKFTPIEVDFGAGKESSLLSIPGKAPFSVLICFEDTIAPLAARAVRAGARWLVNQTNDAWFDPSAASEQHMAHAVFRCIENRVPMVRCCNTGVTCIIDAYGQVHRNLAVRTQGFTIGQIHPRPAGRAETFYTRHGDLFAKICLVLGASSFVVLRPAGWKIRKKAS